MVELLEGFPPYVMAYKAQGALSKYCNLLLLISGNVKIAGT